MNPTGAFRLLHHLATTSDRTKLTPDSIALSLGFSRHEFLEAFEWLRRNEFVREVDSWVELTDTGWSIVAQINVGGVMKHDVQVNNWQDEALLSVLERTAKIEARIDNGMAANVTFCKNTLLGTEKEPGIVITIRQLKSHIRALWISLLCMCIVLALVLAGIV